TTVLKTFWALDLSSVSPHWEELEPWPGPERMLAVAGEIDGAFYLVSGTRLDPDKDGKPVRQYLTDAYCYKPGQGWQRIADVPHACVAAPSPASTFQTQLLVLGGDDGAQVRAAPDEHRGFPRHVQAYDPRSDTWTIQGEVPFSLVTTPLVSWKDW